MNYSGIYYSDMGNGPGWRVTLFVSGCTHHCPECQNLEAQDYNYGKLFDKEINDKIIFNLKRPNIKGLTLSGGDPLCQDNEGLKQLIELCKEAHKLNKNVWLWTGSTWEEIFDNSKCDSALISKQELIKNCDVIVDGPFVLEKKDLSLAWRGSSNQRIINVQESIKNNEVVLWEQQ